MGTPDVLPVLVEHLNDPVREVSETCQIAVDRVKWENGGKQAAELSGDYRYSLYIYTCILINVTWVRFPKKLLLYIYLLYW